MIKVIVICAVSIAVMIAAVLFFPKIKLFGKTLDTYWLVATVGAIVLLLTGSVGIKRAAGVFLANNAVNPIKILVLFISMTVLSVYLDELGFFEYLADAALKRAGSNQKKLFFYLYITVSVLTVFTSNDVIVLSFTPFICYFAHSAKIDPMPYLAAEFVAANTWSMALIIGNPTNIYLASASNMDFLGYFKVMILPTLAAGVISAFTLYLFFRRKLSASASLHPSSAHIYDKAYFTAGIIHLSVCTLLLSVSSYIGLEMWWVALGAVVSLFITTMIINIVKRKGSNIVRRSLKRAPWQLVPFIISMFITVIALTDCGASRLIGRELEKCDGIFGYGIVSFLSANIINNIPMSVLFSSVISESSAAAASVYAVTVGSNLGAFLTPIGALAGIMFSSMLGERKIKFGYADFIKIGIVAAVPALAAALIVLKIIL